MDNSMEQGSYIAQLREVFDSFDEKQTGYLGEDDLLNLCNQLQLSDQAEILVHHLLRGNGNAQVDFNEFKEGLIALLTQSSGLERLEDPDDYENVFTTANREVSPKFVLGAKKYGRRSRPSSIIENEDTLATEDFEETSDFVNSTKSFEKVSLESSLSSTPELLETIPKKHHPFLKSHTEPFRRFSDLGIPMSLPSSPEHVRTPGDLSRNSSFQSQSDSENCHWGTPEEYLRNLWKRLNIGKDGYLNLEELSSVCSHIGMETTKETVDQLFDKLDCDRDGRVTFEELLQGLFQHGVPDPQKSPALSEMSFTCSPVNHRVFRHSSPEEMQTSEPSNEAGIFSSIDPDGNGYVSASAIVDLWESISVPNGMQLLTDLGFNTKMKINLQDLTLLLEEELVNSSTDLVYQAALSSLQNELRHLKVISAQLKTERDKLKEAVLETNERAAMLAQEIDDHHARLEETSQNKIIGLEKKYHDQLRELQEELRRERELLTVQMTNVKQQLEKELEVSHAEQGNLKKELLSQQAENLRLEKELQDLLSRCNEAESRNEQLQKELDSLADARQKLSFFESSKNEENSDALKQEIEELKRQNQDLQDHTVELSLEIDNLKIVANSSTAVNTKRHNRTNSWLVDYNKSLGEPMTAAASLKRRGSGSSSEGNSEDDNRMVGKVRRRLSISSGLGDPMMLESYETEDVMEGSPSLEEDQIRIIVPKRDLGATKLSSSHSYPKFTEVHRTSGFSSLQTPKRASDLAKQLEEEVTKKNKDIEEKERTIAQLQGKYDVMMSSQEKKLNVVVERCNDLQLMMETMQSEISNALCDLYQLVQSYVKKAGGGGLNDATTAHSLKLKIEERFSKALLLAQPLSDAQQRLCPTELLSSRDVESQFGSASALTGRRTETQPSKMDTLLRDLFVENGRLVKELKMTEEQRMRADHSNMRLQYKCKVLATLLKDVTHASIN